MPGNQLSRRDFIVLAGAVGGGLLLGGCATSPSRVAPTADEVSRAEGRRRRAEGTVHEIDLTAAPVTLDLAGVAAETWAYGGAVPGPEVRVRAGDVLRARFVNRLPEETTVHWHGIALRNDMDGAAGVTQSAVPPGATFVYEFTVPDPGTFWFHPHVGLQLDRGLYAPLIVEDPKEPGGYDREYVVVLDDWSSGLGAPPEETFEELQAGRGPHAAHSSGGGPRSDLVGGPGGDVTYPLFLMNGRAPRDPAVLAAERGQRLRLRIVNAASDTPFRVALGGHRLTVTHTDGFPVEPVTVDALLIGMSERYDVIVTAAEEGSFPLVAAAEAKGNHALGIVNVGPGAPTVPQGAVRPAELDGRVLGLADLRAAPAVTLAAGPPDRTHNLVLDGGEEGYRWTINGRSGHHGADPLPVKQGEKVRLNFENRTTMFHPMHLHGHTFQVVEPTAGGPRKDSLIVLPNQRVGVDFIADNPGQWVVHCHNVYHQNGGMESVISYVR